MILNKGCAEAWVLKGKSEVGKHFSSHKYISWGQTFQNFKRPAISRFI